MNNNIRWGLDNPHLFSQMKTELIWKGKYDEYGSQRAVDVVDPPIIACYLVTLYNLINICYSSRQNH